MHIKIIVLYFHFFPYPRACNPKTPPFPNNSNGSCDDVPKTPLLKTKQRIIIIITCCYTTTCFTITPPQNHTLFQLLFLFFLLSTRMACVTHHNWLNLSNMVSEKRFPLSSSYRLEKVFPVYAMGLPDPDPESILDVSDPIWEAVKQEAKLEAEKEPVLSSFLYASVLAHECLEQVLAFVVANRLQSPTLLATQLMDIICNVFMHDKAIQRSIRIDVQAFKDRDPACLSYCSAILYMKGFHSLQVYRVAHALWHQGRKVLALALQSRVSEVFGIDIHPAAKIGEGILLDHGTGVVIGETAVIGNRVSLMQAVTLGGTGKETGDRHPKVGEGALIGAGSTILGNIKIGEGVMIAAGSLVLNDAPPRSIVAGIPAKVIGGLREHDPSLTMRHDATKQFFSHVATNFRDEKSCGTQNPDKNEANT